MEKILKKLLTIVCVFVVVISLAGCGKNENGGTTGGDNTKSFPTASFIPSDMEYTGSGKIVHSTKNESSSPKVANVYYQNAKIEDVISYVDSLKSKGLTKANAYAEDQTGFDEYGSYSWVGVNSDDTFSISITITEEESAGLDYNYNLSIYMANENPYK